MKSKGVDYKEAISQTKAKRYSSSDSLFENVFYYAINGNKRDKQARRILKFFKRHQINMILEKDRKAVNRILLLCALRGHVNTMKEVIKFLQGPIEPW